MSGIVSTFKRGENKIVVYNMDCIEGMRNKIENGSVDVVVTSPPYNLGIRYEKYDDAVPREKYLRWIGIWAGVVKEILSDKGSLFLNIGSKPTDPCVPFEVLSQMRKHFCLQNVVHWIKSIAIQKEEVGDYPGISSNVSIGHYKPINSNRFVNDCHEYIFHLTKNGDVELDRLSVGVEYQDKSNIGRWDSAKEDRRCRGNIWFVSYKTIKDRAKQRPHPATFPLKIPKMCIMLHGVERTRIVVDPFVGIGNSALACVELGVDFVGFEIDQAYYEETCMAMENVTENAQLSQL